MCMNRCEHLSFLSTLNVQLDGREEHLAKFDKMFGFRIAQICPVLQTIRDCHLLFFHLRELKTKHDLKIVFFSML